MAVYYVRKTGSDAAAGTSAGTAWLTIDKAANTVAAGDTVYIGAGVYRELVTMDTSGSSGSVISYIADIDGSKTGDAGLVIISAHDDDAATATRANCWNMNGKTFVEVHDIVFIGGTGDFVVGNTAHGSATAYEGCVFNGCVLSAQGRVNGQYGLQVELNAGVTPTASGLKVIGCTFTGGIKIDWDKNVTDHVNVKIVIDGCRFFGSYDAQNTTINLSAVGTTGSFSIGGVQITHNTILTNATKYVIANNVTNTTNPIGIYNNIFVGSNAQGFYFAIDGSSTSGAVVCGGNLISSPGLSTGATDLGGNQYNVTFLLGGIHDAPFIKKLGYSPYQVLEPMDTPSGFTNPAIDKATVAYSTESLDTYGNSRQMGRPSIYAFDFDGSDAAPTDPDGAWNTDSNLSDGSTTTSTWTSTTGSISANYIHVEGTRTPATGGAISSVKLRIWANTSATRVLGYAIYTNALGETLLDSTYTLPTSLGYSSWIDVPAPSGGWDWTKVGALEARFWRTADGSGNCDVYNVQIGVNVSEAAPDVGAVEARTRPTKESTTVRTGTYAAKFLGAGYKDFWRAVDASSTTISVYARYDSNYTGTKPTLQILNIPGVADQSDTVSGAADTWEQLTCTFTPMATGFVRVRISSNDTSATGKAVFDDFGS